MDRGLFVVSNGLKLKLLLLLLSFWRHPFTAKDPKVSKWYDTFVLMKNQTNLHLGWLEGESIFSTVSLLDDYSFNAFDIFIALPVSLSQSFECGVAAGTEAVQQKELEQREREHAELTDRLAKEKEQIEEELRLFEEKMRMLREEEKRVNEERARLKEEGRKVQKERNSLETQIRIIEHDSNHRQGILPSIISQEKWCALMSMLKFLCVFVLKRNCCFTSRVGDKTNALRPKPGCSF